MAYSPGSKNPLVMSPSITAPPSPCSKPSSPNYTSDGLPPWVDIYLLMLPNNNTPTINNYNPNALVPHWPCAWSDRFGPFSILYGSIEMTHYTTTPLYPNLVELNNFNRLSNPNTKHDLPPYPLCIVHIWMLPLTPYYMLYVKRISSELNYEFLPTSLLLCHSPHALNKKLWDSMVGNVKAPLRCCLAL